MPSEVVCPLRCPEGPAKSRNQEDLTGTPISHISLLFRTIDPPFLRQVFGGRTAELVFSVVGL